MNGFLETWVLFLCLLGSGFFSGMETGIVSVNSLRLRHLLDKEVRRARHLKYFINDPELLLGTTLVGTNLCNVALTVLAASLGDRWLTGVAGSIFSGLLITILILVFGEYLPKAWFQSHPATRSMYFVLPLRGFGYLFRPVSELVALLTAWIPAPREAAGNQALHRRDIQFVFSRESGATPDLDERKRDMIAAVFDLSEQQTRDLMTPREQMVSISPQMPIQEVLALAHRTRHKNFPVLDPRTQRFTGILNVTDLYAHIDDPDKTLPELLRPPQYIEESLPADDLLPRMRLTRQPLLLVRNAQSQVTGFVTTEVVLAQIVGPL